METAVTRQGMTIVPLKLFFNDQGLIARSISHYEVA